MYLLIFVLQKLLYHIHLYFTVFYKVFKSFIANITIKIYGTFTVYFVHFYKMCLNIAIIDSDNKIKVFVYDVYSVVYFGYELFFGH